MSVILPALAVAFIAFCIWLSVRIVNRRERWAKRTAVALVVSLPLLYVASFGPACWLVAAPPDSLTRRAALSAFYLPIGRAITAWSWFGDAMFAYASFGMQPGTRVMIPIEPDAYVPHMRQ
jgi:hypothetical protein